MAVRMAVARLERDPIKTIRADEYDKPVHGPVRCVGCGCVVRGVPITTSNRNGRQIVTNAYFGLPGNVQGQGHAAYCRFNVPALVRRLVARSSEVKKFDPNAEPLLSAIRGDKVELRLHILMETFISARLMNTQGDLIERNSERRIGARYSVSNRALSHYLRMAKAILSLMSRVQEYRSLDEQIVLKYGRHSIAWKDFFFDLERYCELHNHLIARPQSEIRPVAMVVKFGASPLKEPTRFGHWPVFGKARLCRHAGEPLAIHPVLYASNEALARRIVEAQTILVCASPRIGTIWKPKRPGLNPQLDVKLNIVNQAQFCRFSPVDYEDERT